MVGDPCPCGHQAPWRKLNGYPNDMFIRYMQTCYACGKVNYHEEVQTLPEDDDGGHR